MSPVATTGPVHVIGAGLLGASIGLGLSTRGVRVTLEDASPAAAALAAQVGAGQRRTDDDAAPRLVVVAVPPDLCGSVVARALAEHPNAIVTDVASVKAPILSELQAAGADLTRYVGSHPMAGRERSGAIAAQADLFVGRPWVIAPSPTARDDAVLAVRALAADLGASPLTMPAGTHDRAVALVSHLPQLLASLLAAQLTDASEQALGLAGQGLRDTTRIAASEPGMWAAIVAANAPEVLPLLRRIGSDIAQLTEAIERAVAADESGPALEGVGRLVERGNAGARRIPGKHGGAHREWDEITVLVPDEPGQLGRLFQETGAAGVNLEDFAMDHSPGQPVGLVVLYVAPGAGDKLASELNDRGWTVVS